MLAKGRQPDAGDEAHDAVTVATTVLVPKISKTTPCKVAWRPLACGVPRKHFDTSGKSPAIFHHRAILKTQTTSAPSSGRRNHAVSPSVTASARLTHHCG